MSWLADNATTLYVLLAILAAGLVVAWRFNEQGKFLIGAFGVLLVLVLVWLLANYVPSDRKQLEDNVHAMADAVVDGKVDDLMRHVSKDFKYKDMTRERLSTLAQQSVKANRVREVRITKFEVSELSRANKVAKTSFRVTVWGEGQAQPYMFTTQADFALEGEQWKLMTMRFYNPLVDQDREIDLPGIR